MPRAKRSHHRGPRVSPAAPAGLANTQKSPRDSGLLLFWSPSRPRLRIPQNTPWQWQRNGSGFTKEQAHTPGMPLGGATPCPLRDSVFQDEGG